MPRLARVVLPGVPHHVTQRGVRSMQIFQHDADRLEYLRLLKTNAEKYGIRFMAYCLMTNHVHLVAIPESKDSLARAIGEAHKAYTRAMNLRLGVRGYLFQGRFFSCPMDDRHAMAAAAYAERNPVRAGMVDCPWKYLWSSAGFHIGLSGRDLLVEPGVLVAGAEEWRKFLKQDPDGLDDMRAHFRTGRVLGAPEFEIEAERITGRRLRPLPAGRKKSGNRYCVSDLLKQ
ncbi:MAG: hypothetical protein AUJ51_05650 [Elusimicrobia bacterium CG1_02_56_21]|nr:MAG: hypothetical protein AUJ51_05650 [Elusimicrobia bacterium CG1_02_56_21]